MRKVEVVVVGAGPAGLTAASEIANRGGKVLILDENAKPGGQLFKQLHKFFGSSRHLAKERGFKIAQSLVQQAQEAGVEIWFDAIVIGIFEDRVLGVVHEGKLQKLQADRIVLATGASEKALAFPGWTLPGVMGAGAAQTMMNIHGILPGKRILMVGSGNVGLIVSYQLLQAGAKVEAVVEAASKVGGYQVHADKIRRIGVPIYLSHTVKEAFGDCRVEGVTLVQLDENGQPIAGTEWEIAADTICLAVGLSPMAELIWGTVQFAYINDLGGHVPLHNEDMETTAPGVYVAGDVAGIGEASSAIEEGRLAGIAIAADLGYVPTAEAKHLKEQTQKELDALRQGPVGGRVGQAKRALVDAYATDIARQAGREVKERAESTWTESATEVPRPVPEVPGAERRAQGPVAVIECYEEIPCDPCEEACNQGAIFVGEPITSLPHLKAERCNGCGLCIPACPGLAIFVIDESYSEDESTIMQPYEFLPLPRRGMTVKALDCQGQVVGEARVLEVRNPKAYDCTPVIKIAVSKKLSMTVRHISLD
jgi:thioredoxin reductase/Fe-S-cluster-containing hydrogenase component 2